MEGWEPIERGSPDWWDRIGRMTPQQMGEWLKLSADPTVPEADRHRALEIVADWQREFQAKRELRALRRRERLRRIFVWWQR
jgi:hypothetical protein